MIKGLSLDKTISDMGKTFPAVYSTSYSHYNIQEGLKEDTWMFLSAYSQDDYQTATHMLKDWMLFSLVLSSVLAHVSRCSAVPYKGVCVDCSSQGLRTFPLLHASTTDLLLQDNLLTAVSPGHFDMLTGLQRLNLSGNPFHCNCGILYLRQWLQRNKAVSESPVCVSPPELAYRSIAELTDADLRSCASESCSEWLYNATVCSMLCFLIGLLLWCVQLARNSTFILGIDVRHSGFEAESLRSLKPKHRARVRCSIGDDMDKPLLNMDILPQILDVLHKQHNIKIKVP